MSTEPQVLKTSIAMYKYNGLVTLPATDSVNNSVSDSKSNGNVVLYSHCSHCTDFVPNFDPDPQSLLCPFLGQISIPRSGSESVSGNVNKPLAGQNA